MLPFSASLTSVPTCYKITRTKTLCTSFCIFSIYTQVAKDTSQVVSDELMVGRIRHLQECFTVSFKPRCRSCNMHTVTKAHSIFQQKMTIRGRKCTTHSDMAFAIIGVVTVQKFLVIVSNSRVWGNKPRFRIWYCLS